MSYYGLGFSYVIVIVWSLSWSLTDEEGLDWRRGYLTDEEGLDWRR